MPGAAPSATLYLELDTNTLNGYLNNLAVSRVFGGTSLPTPKKRFWEYKYFDAIGASGQTFIPWLKGVLRGEVSYEIGLPENKAFTKDLIPALILEGHNRHDRARPGECGHYL